MTILEGQTLIIGLMKSWGIDKETAMITAFLETEEQILNMMTWMRSLNNIPSVLQIKEKVMQIIKES